MINKKYLYNFLIFFLIFLIQIYFPTINLKEIQLQADIVLVYITIMALIYGRFTAIIIGFTAGFIQDISTQSDLIGIYSLSKSISAYCLGIIFNYQTIWSRKMKHLVILGSYMIHFSIYFYFLSRSFIDIYYFLILIVIQSMITFILFLACNNLFHRKRLL